MIFLLFFLKVLEFIGDLADFKNLELLVNKTVERFGGIDILVNNAGFGNAASIEQVILNIYNIHQYDNPNHS